VRLPLRRKWAVWGLPMCREHQLLLEKYETANKTHSENLKKICDVIGSIPHSEFMDLWRTLRLTRERLEEAGKLLKKHISEHDC
jgi:hypothetical protein